ncbi:uncharacterized protein [Spinacia oleracea]|uniref:FBD domain-containing protein n=1 Tax=Spinacia oleracea TaxID=3562 RepID=A0ABM3R790_SPIOL|nr:uncharacterized protein LOC130466975 [Spinacia oleracea]
MSIGESVCVCAALIFHKNDVVATSCRVARSFPLAFNHLDKLCLTQLDFSVAYVRRFVFGIKDLEISVKPNTDTFQHKIDWNDNYKLSHLTRVKFTGITTS